MCLPKHIEAKFLGALHSDTGIAVGALHGFVTGYNIQQLPENRINTAFFDSVETLAIYGLLVSIPLLSVRTFDDCFRYLVSAGISTVTSAVISSIVFSHLKKRE